MSELEDKLRLSVVLAQARKECMAANMALCGAQDRIEDLQMEIAQLKLAIKKRDLLIDVLKMHQPAFLRKQAD